MRKICLNLTKELRAYTYDIKAWMVENQLKLNNYKTEGFFFFFSSSKPAAISLPDLIILCGDNITFSDSARNLGFILDSELSKKKHVIKICQTAYFELKHINSICRFLTEDATKTFVTSYILSQLDYCNCLLMVHPILSSNLSRKFKILLQDSSSRYLIITTVQNSSAKAAMASYFRTH